MKKIYYLIFLIFPYFHVVSQNISGNSDWKTKEDFKAAEPKIIENILWLEKTPFSPDTTLRKNVGAYVFKWIIDCPYITLGMDLKFEGVLLKDDKCQNCHIIAAMFLMGKTLSLIENLEKPDECKANIRGIESMISIYNEIVKQKGESVKNSIMENYISLKKQNKLEEYVKKEMDKK